jgi:hypothetical protein
MSFPPMIEASLELGPAFHFQFLYIVELKFPLNVIM